MKELQNHYYHLTELQQVVLKFTAIVVIFMCAAYMDAHAVSIFNF